MVIIVTPNKLAPDGMVGVSELVDRFYATVKKVMVRNDSQCKILFISCLYVHFGQPDLYVSLFVYGFYFSQIHIHILLCAGCNGPWLLRWYEGYARYLFSTDFLKFWVLILASICWKCHCGFMLQGAVLIKNLAAKEPSALGLDTYYKQYYLCLAATAATVKWYFQDLIF